MRMRAGDVVLARGGSSQEPTPPKTNKQAVKSFVLIHVRAI